MTIYSNKKFIRMLEKYDPSLKEQKKDIKHFAQKYQSSRKHKDEVLKNHNDDLSEVLKSIQPPYSSELRSSYSKINEAYKEHIKTHSPREITLITQEMEKLYLYAHDNFVDIDFYFTNYDIQNIIKYCINPEQPSELKKATIAFLTNIFQNDHTNIMTKFIEDDIIEYLYDLLTKSDTTLIAPIIQCVANISSDSKFNRDQVFQKFTIENLYLLIRQPPIKNNVNAIANLVSSYCLYPFSNDLIQANEEGKMTIYDFIYTSFEEKIGYENFPPLLKTLMCFINSDESVKFFGPKSEDFALFNHLEYIFIPEKAKSDQDENNSNNEEEKVNIIEMKAIREEVVILNLKVFNKLFEKFKNSLEFINLEHILELFEDENEKIAWHAIRLISNVIVINPSKCELFNIEKYMELLFKICNDGKGKLKKEVIFLLTNLIRASDKSIFSVLRDNYIDELMPILIDSLYWEDPDLVDAVICSLTKMIEGELVDETSDDIKNKLKELGGDEAIEMLINSQNVDVSQQANAFKNFAFEENQPYYLF